MMKKISYFLMFFVAITTSCQNVHSTPQAEVQQECLPSLENFSYLPQGGERDGPQRELIYPSGSWQYVASIPGFKSSKDSPAESTPFIIQPSDNGSVAWISDHGQDVGYLRYSIKSNNWDKVNFGDLHPSLDSMVFLDNKNNVWMAEWVQTSINTAAPDARILSHYDEQDNSFKTVLKLSDFLNAEQIMAVEGYGIAQYAIDGSGNFWFIFVKDKDRWLFRYSPDSMKLERHLSNIKLAEDSYDNILAVSSKNEVFILDYVNKNIIQYKPSDGTIDNKKIPSEIVKNSDVDQEMRHVNLFIDTSNRLWHDDRGWLDLNGDNPDWHIVIRSPIFIKYQYYMWSWPHPVFSTVTKDGRLWFYSDGRGTGWVDPKKATWCLFTTLSSEVVKDADGNLWVLTNGKLYMHPAIP